MTNDIFRTKSFGCFRERSNLWGSYLAPCDDPTANTDISREDLKAFHLKEDINKIPADLWSAWIQLCMYFTARSGSLEVGARILRNEERPEVFRMLIPVQTVSGGSVDAPNFNNSIDLITGELIPLYPPDGWIPVGSTHNHGTITAMFSSVDDHSELPDPGLHVVVGSVNINARTYQMTASITASKKRYTVPFNSVIDTTPMSTTYHPGVLDNISKEVYLLPSKMNRQFESWIEEAKKPDQETAMTPVSPYVTSLGETIQKSFEEAIQSCDIHEYEYLQNILEGMLDDLVFFCQPVTNELK